MKKLFHSVSLITLHSLIVFGGSRSETTLHQEIQLIKLVNVLKIQKNFKKTKALAVHFNNLEFALIYCQFNTFSECKCAIIIIIILNLQRSSVGCNYLIIPCFIKQSSNTPSKKKHFIQNIFL